MKKRYCKPLKSVQNHTKFDSFYTAPPRDCQFCYNGPMKYYDIEQINRTGIARAIYTTADHPDWKYGKEPAISNCAELSAQLGITPDEITMANQTHTSVIRVVDGDNGGELVTRPLADNAKAVGNTASEGPADLSAGFDGLVTNDPGLMICTVEADCVPVYMLDPVHRAIGMVHSGWRGTVGEICAKAVLALHENYGSEPGDLIVHIGPCICENCYEVGAELIEKFTGTFGEDVARSFFTSRDEGGIKYNLDMKKAIRHTLAKSGVNPDKITAENRCTFETDELCSWRRQRPVKTSMLTAIMLNK